MTSTTSISMISAPVPVRPMLASPLTRSRFCPPVYIQPKVDGIRALGVGSRLQGRSGKPLRNNHLQAWAQGLADRGLPLHGLDGELVIGMPWERDCYRRTASVINSDSKPITDLNYLIFDRWDLDNLEFANRYTILACQNYETAGKLQLLPTHIIHAWEDLMIHQTRWVEEGFEGLVVRAPEARYKHGRATPRSGALLKLKQWEDAECRVIGIEERMHNSNEDTRSPLGLAERGHSKAGMVGTRTLGALILAWGDRQLRVGTGFSEADRRAYWAHPPIGQLVKFRYTAIGMKDLPRHPSFLGIRAPEDCGGEAGKVGEE